MFEGFLTGKGRDRIARELQESNMKRGFLHPSAS
ncbi:hypothetical protein [Paenibacillus sp. FJAT-26967]|nr:hypothetical protein [Paenibacillus sp. FJAT-26967]